MLYCISANYTPKAMQAMAKKPNTNRRDAVEKLVKAAGGKLVAMYGTMVDGPGAMVIVDVDPGVGAAIAAVVASSDGVRNVKAQRLFTMDEVIGIRKKRIELRRPTVRLVSRSQERLTEPGTKWARLELAKRTSLAPFTTTGLRTRSMNRGGSGHGYIYSRRIDVVGGIDDQVIWPKRREQH